MYILKKNNIKILIIYIFLLVSQLIILNNKLNINISNMHVDEIHTINFAIDSLYTGKVETLRVGEGTRWFARLIYPLAITSMNSKMGGEHFLTGFDYPGGAYLKSNFKDTNIKFDPNIQDFIFAMRFYLGFLVIASFILASLMINLRYGLVSGLAYFTIAMSTTLIQEMLNIFYTESALIIIFNLILTIGLIEWKNKFRLLMWSAFICAFSASVKLTGIILILPLIAVIMIQDHEINKGMKIEIFLFLMIIFFLLINIYSSSYIELINQNLSNIYHLKTGHLNTYPSGFYQLLVIIKHTAPWNIIFLLSFYLVCRNKIPNKLFLISIAFSSILIFMSMVDVSFSLIRNYTTPMVMMICVIAISAYFIIEINLIKYKNFLLISCFIIYNYSLFNNFNPIIESNILSHTKNCSTLGIVGFKDKVKESYIKIKDIPNSFQLKRQESEFIKYFEGIDCVIIDGKENNKQYTHYIMDKINYTLQHRIGEYYFFQLKK